MINISDLESERLTLHQAEFQLGDVLERGQRYGMIRFGSRVDLYMPEGYVAAAQLGQQVFAGQCIVARAGQE